MFVNRVEELAALRSWWSAGDALALVWVRRRAGKSWLVARFAEEVDRAVVHVSGARALAQEKTPPASRLLRLEAIAQSPLDPLPPARVRELYGLRYGPREEMAFANSVRLMRAMRWLTPPPLRRGYNTRQFDGVAATERRRIERGHPTPQVTEHRPVGARLPA